MNSWGKRSGILLILLFVIFACKEEDHLLGFQSPDENFKIVYKEFTLPTSVFQVDSLPTSNSGVGVSRVLAGTMNDPVYGSGTATAYLQYFPTSFPSIPDTAVFVSVKLKLVIDFYTYGSQVPSTQTFQIRELTDSLINSQSYFTTSSTETDTKPLITVAKQVDPGVYHQGFKENRDANPQNDEVDSLVVNFGFATFGQNLFDAIRKTDSASVAQYQVFSRWRRKFKGLAIVPAGTDKIIGFDPAHKDSQISISYKDGPNASAIKNVTLSLSPLQGMMTYSNITLDRTGTPLSVVNGYYTSVEPADGSRYVQSGSGIVTRIDMTPVYDYFGEIAVKSLNVAELSIKTEVQELAPTAFFLRAIRADNRSLLGLTKVLNEAYDSISIPDQVFASKHHISPSSAPRADLVGDDGTLFYLSQNATTPDGNYKGYLTNFLQREINLPGSEQLDYLSIIPAAPEFSKSVNGLQFHKDSVRLRVYYTTTNTSQE